MTEALTILGTLLGVIISIVIIARLLFYTKSEINTKFEDAQKHSDTKDEQLKDALVDEFKKIKEQLETNKEKTYEKLLEAERESNRSRQEIYDKLTQTRQLLDEYNKNMVQTMAQIRQEDINMSTKYTQLVNVIKDELKNDYINRYNELLQIINTKVNVQDFDRLELKFDKVCESLTELKTIIQIDRDKNKHQQK